MLRRLLPLLILLTSFAPARAVDVSILDFQRKPSALKKMSKDEAEFLAGKVRKVASQSDRTWRVLSRETIQKVLEENGKDYAECMASAEGKCEVAIGQILQADYHVVGDFSFVGGEIALSMRLYDVKTSSLKSSEDVTGPTVKALLGVVDAGAKRLFSSVTGGGSAVAGEPAATGGGAAEAQVAPPEAGAVKRVVQFASAPEGAAVTVDGKFLCQTPNGKSVVDGEHWIEMGKDGYTSRREKIRVSTNGQSVSWSLDPIRTRLSLDAVDDRTGGDLVADVYVDGAKVGQTPFDDLVPVAAQTIEVAPSGFERQTVSVTLEEGKAASTTAHFRGAEPRKAVAAMPVASSSSSQNGMVSIPAGCFEMGSNNRGEKPKHRVCLAGR